MPLVDPTTQSGVQPVGFNSNFSLGLSDEFNTAALDTDKWSTVLSGQAAPSTTNFDITGGNLRIWPESTFTARYIHAEGNFAFTHGVVEIRAKLPRGKGVSSNLW